MNISQENKKFLKNVSIISIPIVFQELINSCINMVDVFMIGGHSPKAIVDLRLASVGLANQIFFLYILFAFGAVSGGSIFIGQYWGQKDEKNIRKSMGLMTVFTILAASIFAIPAIFCPEFLMGIYSKDANIIKMGSDYLRIIAYSYFLCSFSITISISLRSMGYTVFPMITSFAALICNICFNYYFIFCLNQGVEGAAKATLISRTIELLGYILLIGIFKLPVRGKVKEYFDYDKNFIKRYWKSAWPVIVNECAWALGVSMYMVAYGKIGLDALGNPTMKSTEAIATVQIANNINNIFCVVGIGVGISSGIVIGNLLGANKIEKAIKYSRKFMKLIVFVSLIMSTFLILTANIIVNLFTVTDVVKVNLKYCLYWIGIFMPILMLNFTSIVGILRSGGDTKFCCFVDVSSVWFVGVVLAFTGAVFLKLPIYLVMPLVMLEEILKFTLTLPRVLSNKWAKNIID